MTNYLTSKEVGQILKMCPKTAYALMKSSGFPSIKIGRKLFVSEDEFEKFMKNKQNSRKL